MYSNTSMMANSILRYIHDNPEMSCPEQVYNGWAKADGCGYGMDRQQRVRAAYSMIQSLLKAGTGMVGALMAMTVST